MADDRSAHTSAHTSVHTHLQRYEAHLDQLEELRALLQAQLGAARRRLATVSGRHARGAARRRAAEIEAALDRLHRGRYGICQRCAAFIPLDQLRRAPQRRTCDTCAASVQGVRA